MKTYILYICCLEYFVYWQLSCALKQIILAALKIQKTKVMVLVYFDILKACKLRKDRGCNFSTW
jgi:hypothetical protein